MSEHNGVTFDVEPLRQAADSVRIGNVYKAKGGRGNTEMWLVVSYNGETVHLLGLAKNGEVVSTASYGMHAIKSRDLIARCDLTHFNYPIRPV